MSDSESKVHVMHRTGSGLKPDVKPIVLEYKKGKKSSGVEGESQPRYSKGLKDIQTLEADILSVSQKAAKALSKGIDTYQEEREKSASEKKDGAIEDFVNNSAKAMSASIKEASDIPVDIAESMNTSTYRKLLRRSLRDTSRVIGFWRI